MKRYIRVFQSKTYGEMCDKNYHFMQFCNFAGYQMEVIECTYHLDTDDWTHKIRVRTNDGPERLTKAADKIDAGVTEAYKGKGF